MKKQNARPNFISETREYAEWVKNNPKKALFFPFKIAFEKLNKKK